MTLLQMKYFATVCETGNVSKAASQLFVSRVTISRVVKELEKEVGLPLFSRTNAGLILTEQGKSIYGKCLEILHASDVLKEQMNTLREHMQPETMQTIRIGVTPVTAVSVFPELYRFIRESGASIRLYSVEYNRLHSRNALENGTIDFHLSADSDLERLPNGFERCKLRDSRLVFCMSADHPLAGREFVTAEDIREEPLIYLSRTYQPEERIEKLYAQIGSFPRVKYRSMQLSTVRGLVKEKFGCAILMEGAIDDGVDVVSCPIIPAVNMEICLVWNKLVPHNQAFEDFLKLMQDRKKPD